MQNDAALDADFPGHVSEPIAAIVADVTDFLGSQFSAAFHMGPEHDEVLPCQPFGPAGTSQQLTVEPLYASSVAPGAKPGMTAGPGGIERRARE